MFESLVNEYYEVLNSNQWAFVKEEASKKAMLRLEDYISSQNWKVDWSSLDNLKGMNVFFDMYALGFKDDPSALASY